ncbi:hypothetical protein [Actinokineospora sp.]|uniref:hypothetical protein n=1 Tax=Actinokineospora sp. TaxID=1872133 RepID=UPI004037EC3B
MTQPPVDWSNYPYTTPLRPDVADIDGHRRKLVTGLWVWLPIAAFWLLVAVVSGYGIFWAPLILGPVALVVLAYRSGLGSLPGPAVYLLGNAPVLAFPAVKWAWFIGLLILAMIWGYHRVLDACVALREAQGKPDDTARARLRVERITLIWVSVDAFAAGLDVVLLVVAIIAIVRFGRLSVLLAFVGFAISIVAFTVNGDPALWLGRGEPGFNGPGDIDGWFSLETLGGAVLAWGRTLYQVWLRPPP